MSKGLRVGFPGLVQAIPAPATGMSFNNSVTSESTMLDNGGRHVWTAPIAMKSFNMSWRGYTPKLQPLIDLYNQRYGRRPFYMMDPTMVAGNMLPPRWAYSWQLAHCSGGQGQPTLDTSGLVPRAQFNDKYWSMGLRTLVMVTPGKKHLFKAWGTASNGVAGIRVRKHVVANPAGVLEGWSSPVEVIPTETDDAPVAVVTAQESQWVDFIELEVFVTSGATLSLEHMDLSTEDYRSSSDVRRPGLGVGALQFTNQLEGELVMQKIQRIGLSVDMEEVEYLGA